MDGPPDDAVSAPEANYRRLSTAELVAIRADLIAIHTQRNTPITPQELAVLRAAFPHVTIRADNDPAPAEAEQFFVTRVACIDRILADRARTPDA